VVNLRPDEIAVNIKEAEEVKRPENMAVGDPEAVEAERQYYIMIRGPNDEAVD
jgi:hypothetical protein